MEENEKKKTPEPVVKKKSLLYSIVRVLYLIIAKLFFFIRIDGRENIPADQACILMANHQSVLDPLTLALCCPDRQIYFMGKKELFQKKFFGNILRRVHAFPVDRGNLDMNAVRTAMSILRSGETLGIFPEGTRSRTGYMGPLLGGASLLAIKSACPVVPIYIEGRYWIFHPMRVHIGRPIEMADLLAGRINRETGEVMTGRMQDAFLHLSGGKCLPPPEKP